MSTPRPPPPSSQEGASIVEQILDESDAVGLMQLQCKEAKDDASVMIFPTTDTLSLQQQVKFKIASIALAPPVFTTIRVQPLAPGAVEVGSSQ